RARLRTSLDLLQEKMFTGQLKPEEAGKCYTLMADLMGSQSARTEPHDRLRLVSDFLAQATNSHFVNQGSNPTCNVATVESALYLTKPSAVARILVDVALHGEFTSPEGKTIRWNGPGDTSK